MAATVKPREDMPTADSMSHFDDNAIVRLGHDREFFHHDSCLSYHVRRDCWWCFVGFGWREEEESVEDCSLEKQ